VDKVDVWHFLRECCRSLKWPFSRHLSFDRRHVGCKVDDLHAKEIANIILQKNLDDADVKLAILDLVVFLFVLLDEHLVQNEVLLLMNRLLALLHLVGIVSVVRLNGV
jgi:hypothetical protein